MIKFPVLSFLYFTPLLVIETLMGSTLDERASPFSPPLSSQKVIDDPVQPVGF